MAVDFPSSPTVGQTFTSGGVTWMWDGVKWTSTSAATGLYLPITGGTLTGDLLLNRDAQVALGAATKEQVDAKLSLAGVTNGSDASAGQIGEVISNVNTTGSSIPTSTPRNIIGLALTAGDWDVQGELWFTPAGATMTSVVGALTPTSGAFPTVPDMSVARQQLIGLSALGITIVSVACRASLTAATTYYLVGQVNFTGGTSVTPTGKIWARRAR